MNQRSRLAYQTAATAGVSLAELHAVVYSNLAQDFLKAAAAAREGQISARASASKHALLLIGHLESWLDALEEPKLAASLQQFYAMLRVRTLHLQAAPDSHAFEELADFVLKNSSAWQTVGNRTKPFSASSTLAEAPAPHHTSFSFTA